MKYGYRHALMAASALGVAILGVTGAQAQDVKLRVGDSFPVGHYIPENMTKFWMERVTELTGGEAGFDYYPAEQLGKAKDLLALTQTGVVDVGYVGASYVSDKLPLSSVAELPENFTTSCQGTKAFWEIAKPGGALDQAEFAPNDVRVLMVLVLPPYQVLTSSKEITDLASLRNLKLRTTGGAKEIATVKVGAVPVQISAPETRDALSRGTIDGVLFPHSSVLPYDIHPLLKYGTQNVNFGSFVVTYVISKERWDALPENVQQAFTQAGEEAIVKGCEATDGLDLKDKQTIADSGVTFVSLPAADEEKLMGFMGEVSEEWAAELDGRGRPGTEILNAFREALRSAE
ncbi:TRAP transporter substrate-binding protein DctP [Mesorhizobium sp. CAU 1732]|uniref:TRAP transporter substrate-binding protein n=1 Tax=Mesorhizobium sp. CAU 1732 TaxID=3140358 RepID=UPI003260BC9A